MATNESIVEKRLPLSFNHFFLTRVLLFVCLIVGFNLWLVRHTGHGLRDPRVIGGIGGILFFALSVSKSMVSAKDAGIWKTWSRRIIAAMLDFRWLAGFYIVAIFIMLTISSVTILPGSDGQVRKAALQPVDVSNTIISFNLNANAARQWVWVSPFGRIYRVAVSGYLPTSLEVYPLLGATIHPERDLKRSPTILIRPSIKALQSLKQCENTDNPLNTSVKRCGWFRLCEINDAGKCNEIGKIEGHSSSFLIGWPQAVPQGLLQDWKLELTILGAAKAPEIEAEIILAWKEPMLLASAPPVKVGSTLRAEVYTKSMEKEIVASKTFRVANMPFMDILMETVTDGSITQ